MEFQGIGGCYGKGGLLTARCRVAVTEAYIALAARNRKTRLKRCLYYGGCVGSCLERSARCLIEARQLVNVKRHCE